MSYATFCQGPHQESSRYRDFMGWTVPWYSVPQDWEDSPEGWPQRWGSEGGQFRLDGRPTAQWSRIRAGRDDDLGTTPEGGPSEQHCH